MSSVQRMRRRRFCQGLSALAVGSTWLGGVRSGWTEPIPPSATLDPQRGEAELSGPRGGPWRRLMLDARVVEASAGLTRQFPAAVKHPARPVLVRERPWEGVSAITGPYVYGTVLREAGRFRLWYQILWRGNHIGYAESEDGLHWVKPAVGRIELDGSRDNNLVVSALAREATGGVCHNPSVIRRPGADDPAARYVVFGDDSQSGSPRTAYSPDRLRWTYAADDPAAPLLASSDVVSFFYDVYQQRYAATWKTRNHRARAVGVAWSPDGRRWHKPWEGPVFAADDLDPDATQIYGMPVFPYQGLYLGLPWIYHARYIPYGEYSVERLHEAQADSPRTIDVQIAWSWDLVNWTRPSPRRPWLACGTEGNWDGGSVVTARAPVVVGDELWLYYGGFSGRHDDKRVQAAIGLATLRLDGFCALVAGEEEGWMISRREPMRRPEVMVNARIAPGGHVAAELLDRNNRVLPGFSRQECRTLAGDSVRHVLRWTTQRLPQEVLQSDCKNPLLAEAGGAVFVFAVQLGPGPAGPGPLPRAGALRRRVWLRSGWPRTRALSFPKIHEVGVSADENLRFPAVAGRGAGGAGGCRPAGGSGRRTRAGGPGRSAGG